MDKEKNKPRQILVADDDPAILRQVKTILEEEGFAAITARDGKEAYKLMQSEEVFAAAIFDIVMPHIEGGDLVQYMQSERRLMKIPVIIMTAEQNLRVTSKSFSAGAVAFLPKPFTDSQFKTTLKMFVKYPERDEN